LIVNSYLIIFNRDDGTLELSTIQKENFDSWKRPSEIMKTPQMVAMISSAAIKQVSSSIVKKKLVKNFNSFSVWDCRRS
jgi:hypothetical protein